MVLDRESPETCRRNLKDRRKRPTAPLSWYAFFGRRQDFRRDLDRGKGGYVDRYSPKLFFFLVLILGLNVLDILFTMMILDHQGWEFNPIVRSVMALHHDLFWVWKFGIVSACLTLLCLHSKFRSVNKIIVGISIVYFLNILYQVFVFTCF
ncbi:MAG: hypothetical protein HXY46_05730 [Syntrophaceae bacterium]|nr:hypothetical protein [Syntrophaceae bacterium]